MDVLIFAGQSNMVGTTEALPSPNQAVENALEYRFLEDSLIPLLHPVGEDIGDRLLLGANYGHGCLVPDFCRAYTQKTGKKVIAIHSARGDTRLDEWLKGTARFDAMVRKINAGIQKARELGEIDHIYLIWLQGESDAIYKTPGEVYKQRLTAFKNDLKNETGIEKFGIIQIGYFCALVSWLRDRTREEGRLDDEVIMRAQEELPKEDSDFVFLTDICKTISLDSSLMNPNEQGHYTNRALTIIGTKAGENLASLI